MTTTTPFPMTGPDPKLLPDGTPRPVDKETGKPLMTRTEANWHAHVSGMAARQEAEAGGDPAALAALLEGAAGFTVAPACVGHVPLLPLTVATFEVLRMMGSAHAQENPTGAPIAFNVMDLAKTALVFARPEWCYQCLSGKNRMAEFNEAAMQLAFDMNAKTLAEVQDFIEREMREFFGEDATGKKPDLPASPPEPAGSPELPETTPDLSAGGSPP